ncbi:MAG: hypothetical protein ACO24P_05800 [Candidatus Nanopelagicaceae bacterium]
MSTLNTGLGWVSGDVERVLIATGVWISPFTINEATVCCNNLGLQSPSLVLRVRELLSEFDAAVEAQKEANVGGNVGRVLKKADVLEWDTENSGTPYDGALRERARVTDELTKIFGSCPILSQKGTDSVVALYRS